VPAAETAKCKSILRVEMAQFIGKCKHDAQQLVMARRRRRAAAASRAAPATTSRAGGICGMAH
jgi:hypothetical protein